MYIQPITNKNWFYNAQIHPRTYPISNSDVCPIRFVGDVDIFATELSLL